MYYGNEVRVLVVDDEPSICLALKIALSRAGFDVVTVHSGEDAHNRVMTEHFDVLIADLRMKDMRGDVVYYLALGAQPHLRRSTVFLTGDITDAAERLIDATSCPLLRKPFDLAEIISVVQKLCPRVRPASA
jgi:two-component system, cell cycle response regulator